MGTSKESGRIILLQRTYYRRLPTTVSTLRYVPGPVSNSPLRAIGRSQKSQEQIENSSASYVLSYLNWKHTVGRMNEYARVYTYCCCCTQHWYTKWHSVALQPAHRPKGEPCVCGLFFDFKKMSLGSDTSTQLRQIQEESGVMCRRVHQASRPPTHTAVN
jgi:hypothetical protein